MPALATTTHVLNDRAEWTALPDCFRETLLLVPICSRCGFGAAPLILQEPNDDFRHRFVASRCEMTLGPAAEVDLHLSHDAVAPVLRGMASVRSMTSNEAVRASRFQISARCTRSQQWLSARAGFANCSPVGM